MKGDREGEGRWKHYIAHYSVCKEEQQTLVNGQGRSIDLHMFLMHGCVQMKLYGHILFY